MRNVTILMITFLALVTGASPAAAGEDPLDALWQQQTWHPSHSITVPDISGQPHTIGYVDIDGHAVTEGDIVIGSTDDAASGKVQLPGILPEVTDGFPDLPEGLSPRLPDRPALIGGCDRLTAGAATTRTETMWPDRKVPYVLSAALPPEARQAFDQAVKDFHDNTCVRFVPRTTEAGFLNVIPGSGCYSYVGRTGLMAQDLSIGRGCERKGIVIHELMHALGFYHEHSRSDRDSAVIVHLENVIKGYEAQFQKLTPPQNRLFGAFDYGSVMLYGRNFFSSNGQDTLVPTLSVEIGQRNGFSPADLAAVRVLYGCPAPPRPAQEPASRYSSRSSRL